MVSSPFRLRWSVTARERQVMQTFNYIGSWISGLPIWDTEAASLIRRIAVQDICLIVNSCMLAKQERFEVDRNPQITVIFCP
jgi:hypothetical protein